MDNCIIKQPEFLAEHHIPELLETRERQIQELKLCLAPSLKRRKPMNAWLYGEPGTGKTAVAKLLLQHMKNDFSVKGIYINCWEYKTLYTVIDKIVRDLKIMFAEKPDVVVKMERFRKTIGSQPFIVVLDEIDRPELNEKNAMLYQLSNMGNVGLVCISNSRNYLLNLDQRIHSRLMPKQIEFQPYTGIEIMNILRQRADLALDLNCLDNNILLKISDCAEGDARIAIQTLKKAAEIAEASKNKKISEEHIKQSLDSIKDLKKKYLLDDLTWHHRLIYEIIREQPGITSRELWQYYVRIRAQERKEPVATRTFSAYLSKLLELKLVQSERTNSRVRVFTVL